MTARERAEFRPAKARHRLPAEAVASRLTVTEQGLAPEEAARRLACGGPDEFMRDEGPSPLAPGPIDPSARIVHIADACVSLVEGREASGAAPPAEVLDSLCPLAGTSIGKDVFLALQSLIDRGQASGEMT